MGRVLVVAIACLPGCAQIAGIQKTTSGQGDDVSLQMQRMSIGASIVLAPQDVSAFPTSTYLIPDAAAAGGFDFVDAPATDVDTWSAAIPDGTPAIEFGVPDFPAPFPRIWSIPARHVLGLFAVMEHPDPLPAPDMATLTVGVTLDVAAAASDTFELSTIGSWTQRAFTATEVPVAATTITATFPFTEMSSITGRPLEKLTVADAVIVTRHVAGDLTGAFEAPTFDQTGTDSINGTLVAVAHDRTLDVHLDQMAAATRYAGAMPAVANPTFNWEVVAAPGYATGNGNGIELAGGGLLVADSGVITSTFGNPFLDKHDWRSMFAWSTGASRTFTPTASGLPATLVAGLSQVAEPSTGLVLDLPAGLPQVISINGTALATDGMTVTIDPNAAVTLGFTADLPTNTLYQLTLFELVPNAANTALVTEPRLGMVGTDPSFLAPAQLFEVGHTYTLRAVCLQDGYPDLADGNLQARTLPLAAGFLDSGVFTVVAP